MSDYKTGYDEGYSAATFDAENDILDIETKLEEAKVREAKLQERQEKTYNLLYAAMEIVKSLVNASLPIPNIYFEDGIEEKLVNAEEALEKYQALTSVNAEAKDTWKFWDNPEDAKYDKADK